MLRTVFKLATVSVAAATLTGCCISMPKFLSSKSSAPKKQPAPCASQQSGQIANVPDGCMVCYGESGCCDGKPDCLPTQAKTPEPKQEEAFWFRGLPLHHYGWTPYQRRYGSAGPAIPAPVVVVPHSLRHTVIEQP